MSYLHLLTHTTLTAAQRELQSEQMQMSVSSIPPPLHLGLIALWCNLGNFGLWNMKQKVAIFSEGCYNFD